MAKKKTPTLADLKKSLKSSFKVVEMPVYEDLGKVPTGSLIIDKALGGGIPKGRITYVYAQEGCGKSTLAANILANISQENMVAYIDFEYGMTTAYLETLGVNMSNLYGGEENMPIYPATLEEGMTIVEQLIDTGEIKGIVFDSIAAAVPEMESEQDIRSTVVGKKAFKMGQFIRKILSTAAKNGVTMIFLNQMRENITAPNPYMVDIKPATKAVDFASSCSIRLKKKTDKEQRDGSAINGHLLDVSIEKHKVPPSILHKGLTTPFIYGIGFSPFDEIITLGLECDVLHMAGSWIKYKDADGEEHKWQGRVKLAEILRDNEELYEMIKGEVFS